MTTRFDHFDRSRWAELRNATPLTLGTADLDRLRGLNERLDLDEIRNIYLPLSRLLNLRIAATRRMTAVTDTFLGSEPDRIPFVIGLAGSVAVGKSTAARVLQELLGSWPDHPDVALITTDGFLHPNLTLAERGLLDRKGFPESYDTAALIDFLRRIKSGDGDAVAPTYSHLTYDIVPGEFVAIGRPDVLIVEGLNVLQPGGESGVVASDFFDFGLYLDAAAADIERWYVERFLQLRRSVFANPDSYFARYSGLDDEEAAATARGIWANINGPNLVENIIPTRERANLIMHKGPDHTVTEVRLRKA